MTFFKIPFIWIMVGSAMFGGSFAFVAAFGKEGTPISTSPWEWTVPTMFGAALGASAASALCRIFRTYQFLREHQKRIELADRKKCRSSLLKPKIDLQHRRPSDLQGPIIELTICETRTTSGAPRPVCRQRFSRQELKSVLTSVTNQAELE